MMSCKINSYYYYYYYSYVDFCLVSSNLSDFVLSNLGLDNEMHFSDHMPIKLSIRLPEIKENTFGNTIGVHPSTSVRSNEPICSKSMRWDHCSLSNYYNASYIMLKPIFDEMNFVYDFYLTSDWHCHSSSQNADVRIRAIQLIERVYNYITAGLSKVAIENVPCIENNSLKFWWNAELDLFKGRALTSHRKWIEVGKPTSGPLFEEKKKDKYAYRNCIRQNR